MNFRCLFGSVGNSTSMSEQRHIISYGSLDALIGRCCLGWVYFKTDIRAI